MGLIFFLRILIIIGLYNCIIADVKADSGINNVKNANIKESSNKKTTGKSEDLKINSKVKKELNINDSKTKKPSKDIKKSTMYEDLFDNVELSDDEKKLIGMEKNEISYSKNDAKFTTFRNIKYGPLTWKKIEDVDLSKIDLFSVKERLMHTIQDIGPEGSNAKSLIPEMVEDIGTSFGYNGYDIYETKENNIIFFDTKMPLGDINVSFNLDSAEGFMSSVKTYYSANKNIHLGISFDVLLRRRILSQKTSDKLNLAIINFPIASYFLYIKDKITGLINLEFYNYIHSDHGGTSVDGNPEYVGEEDAQDILSDILNKKQLNLKLLTYFEYRFKPIHLYLQYNLKYCQNVSEINAEKESKEKEIGGKKKKVISYKKDIQSSTLQSIFQDYDRAIKYTQLKNVDKYLENKIEIGVKDNISISKNTYLNYSAYYSFKFAMRKIKGEYNNSKNIDKGVKKDVLQWKFYVDPLILGGHVGFAGITFSPKITLSEKNLYFKLYLGFENKYVNLDLAFTRRKIPLIFREYKWFDERIRSYSKVFDKIPLSLYFNVSANLNIKDVFKIRPNVIFDVNWNKVYFIKSDEDDDLNELCMPNQNIDTLFHLAPSINMVLKIKRVFIDVTPMFNFRFYKKDADLAENEAKDNVPTFSIHSKIYFNKKFSNEQAELTTGAELFWRTRYCPDTYDKVIQQHFSQIVNEDNEDKFKVICKPKINLFINVRFGNFAGAFKLNILNLFMDKTTFASKYYPNNNDYYMFSIRYLIF